ncbi:MAG: fumarate hydratase [Endomicrobia bacterium]|nr:fumarate hydratase [Endomicrobiia bacterium]
MRKIEKEEFITVLKNLIVETSYYLPDDVVFKIKECLKTEDEQHKDLLLKILKNAEIASHLKLPLCQDTGIPEFFIEIGKGVYFNFNLREAICEVVFSVYEEEKLRKSSVENPLFRVSTSNYPVIFLEQNFEDEKCKVSLIIRGGGSENMTIFNSFLPTIEFQEVLKFIVHNVNNMLQYTCPPVVVGIGIGGTSELSMYLAKKSFLRKIGERNRDNFYAETEVYLTKQLNLSNIGIFGLGGGNSVLDVFIETYPTHIASLPVSIQLQCHSYRRGSVLV